MESAPTNWVDYEELIASLLANEIKIKREIDGLKAKWPAAFVESDDSEIPEGSVEKEIFVTVQAQVFNRLMAKSYLQLYAVHNCLSECIGWVHTTRAEREVKKDAMLDFFSLIGQLESQIADLQKALAYLKQHGYPSILFNGT